jgi:Mg-chelatase subunit ChlD
MKTKETARVPMVVAGGFLAALALVACGDAEPGGKTGSGLGSAAKGGTSGTGAKGSGGSSGAINVGSGGTINVGSGGSVATGGSSGSSGSAGSSGTTSQCNQIVSDSSKVDVALLFMVDISGSMNCPVPEASPPCTSQPKNITDTTRWTEMSPALDDFFASFKAEDGFWAGISFFSRNNSCDASAYEKPDAEIAALPAAASGLKQAVDGQTPSGYTPTVPALQGALNHANSWAAAHTDQNVVVVYATDGYPQQCGNSNTIDNAAKAAATAFAGPHQIRTYVLGVGPNLTDLNKIASSGGTDQAAFIDTGQDVTTQLKEKFDQIRTAVATDCKYTVPPPPAGQSYSGYVNVGYTTASSSTPVTIPFDDTSKCDEGWQYSADMSQIILCGSTCDEVKAANGMVKMEFGCQQTVKVTDPR